MTYNLHILLRFELELALIRGELEVADLPAAWNEPTQRLLGDRPPNDGDGVLQDIHWRSGEFGYFPTYTLGNLYSAQLWRRDRAAIRGPRRRRSAAASSGRCWSWLRDAGAPAG